VRYLAIDLGDRRTGLASGDDESGIVSAIGVVEMPMKPGDALLAALVRAVRDHEADELVIGLPYNMDGSEGPRAKLVRAFVERLVGEVDRPVRFQDERLTSVQADWEMARTGMTHKQKKQRRDALAAAAILRDYLASVGSEGESSDVSPDSSGDADDSSSG
jgi:putative Holliday junction resolvase